MLVVALVVVVHAAFALIGAIGGALLFQPCEDVMLKLSQGFFIGMAAFACASTVAAPLQIPTNVPIIEVLQQTNTYNYTPVNEANSTIKRVVPISDALVTGQSVSDAEPKISSARRLPIGTGANVTASVSIPKANVARALVASAKLAGAVAAGPVAAIAIDALIDYGIKNVSVGKDGLLKAESDQDSDPTTYDISDGNIYTFTRVTGYGKPISAKGGSVASACTAWAKNFASAIGKPYASSSVQDAVWCRVTLSDNSFFVAPPYSTDNSQCPSGWYLQQGTVCTQTKPLKAMAEQDILDSIASRGGWPTSASIAVAGMLQYPDTRRILQDYPSNGVDILGPSSVPGKSTTATESVQLVPGTNTVAAPGTPTSQTQPGTKTTTTTKNHPITYSGSSVSYSTVNNSTTNITNNTTNVTTTETKTEESKDDKDEQMPSDTALGAVPELYKQKYPGGLAEVWNQRSQEFKSSGLFSLAEQLMPTSLKGGTCPSFNLDMSIGPWADYGTREVPMPCWIWDTCKYILLLMAAVSARRIVLGADMAAAFSALFSKLTAIVSWFGDLFVAVFKAAWDMLSDVVCWGFDGLLGIAVTAMNAVDLSGLNGAFGAWSQLPPELLNVMGLMGVGAASAIVVSALGIRLLLQLIPFTRLGS